MHTLLSKFWHKRARLAKADKGFTLIELLVVVVILGVLIAIAIPLYLNYRKGANDAAAQSDLKNAISVLEQCNADNPGTGYPSPVTAAGVMTGCANQKISLSNGTVLNYAATAGVPATNFVSYVIAANNTSGTSGKFFCYSSSVGGAVKQEPTNQVTSCA